MVITFRTIKRVTFPVYKLDSSNWEFIDGLLFLNGRIVDDRNMPGNTLGKRRLQTPHKNLYRLHSKIDNLTGIVKQKTLCFVDSNGIPFTYEKTLSCKLKYYRIKEIDRKGTASLLRVYGSKKAFKIPRPPSEEMTWAGILNYHEMPWMLYEYASEKLEDTWRKI